MHACTWSARVNNGNHLKTKKKFNFHRESQDPVWLGTSLKCELYRNILPYCTSRSLEKSLFQIQVCTFYNFWDVPIDEWKSGS